MSPLSVPFLYISSSFFFISICCLYILYLCLSFSSLYFYLPYFCLFLCILYLCVFCVSVLLLSPVSRFFSYLFFSICSLLILYSFLFFISVSSSYLSFLSIYPGMLFFLLYRVSFPMSVCLSFSFLCSSFSDLHNKKCNLSVCHNSGHENVCVTRWTLIVRYQLWMRFAAFVFSDKSRRTDLKVTPNRRWCCKEHTSLSYYAPFPHVQDTIMCMHIEPRHATCKATIATNLNINIYNEGSKNNTCSS
jgi:hypothetical protein